MAHRSNTPGVETESHVHCRTSMLPAISERSLHCCALGALPRKVLSRGTAMYNVASQKQT
eukprot:4633403-Amphidinium_carterae.1